MRSVCLPLVILLLAWGTSAADQPQTAVDLDPVAVRSVRSGQWLIQETANFRVYTFGEWSGAGRLPRTCEELRTRLSHTWLDHSANAWSPKCDVVVHPTVHDYVRTLGPGSEQSSGCASLEIQPGRVTKRRIDLRGDAADCLNCALPHELTHVVVAERFTQRRIPRWADEGMAILAEPAEKQERRRMALQQSLGGKQAFSARELSLLADYPAPGRRDLFYGQSASLVAYLMERESPAKFLEFVELSANGNPEQALAKVYGISRWNDFENEWRERILAPGASAELLAAAVGKITALRETP